MTVRARLRTLPANQVMTALASAAVRLGFAGVAVGTVWSAVLWDADRLWLPVTGACAGAAVMAIGMLAGRALDRAREFAPHRRPRVDEHGLPLPPAWLAEAHGIEHRGAPGYAYDWGVWGR